MLLLRIFSVFAFCQFQLLVFQALTLQDENESISNQLHYVNDQLERLQKTNVLNLTFHIWHDGHFGTINGFRLGRLPNHAVEWSEISAAWGQAAFLLHTLSRRIKLTFKCYELVPYGSFSYLRRLADGASKNSQQQTWKDSN